MAKPSEPNIVKPDDEYTRESDALLRDIERTHPDCILGRDANGRPDGWLVPPEYRQRSNDMLRRWQQRHGLAAPQALRVKCGDYVTINGHRFEVARVNERSGVIYTRRYDTRGGESNVPCDGEGLLPDPPELGPPPPVPALDIADGYSRTRAMLKQHERDLGDRA